MKISDLIYYYIPPRYQPIALFLVAAFLIWRAGNALGSDDKGAFMKGAIMLPLAMSAAIAGLLMQGGHSGW